jgi:hypothetical protein
MSFLDRFFGRGRHAITVPALDGAFRANDALDRAEVLHDRGPDSPCPGAICALPSGMIYAAGRAIWQIGGATPLAECDHDIRILFASGDGAIAGLTNGDLVSLDAQGKISGAVRPTGLSCLTSGLDLGDRGIVLTNGSAHHGPDDWARDLLTQGTSGQVLILTSQGDLRVLADNLAWPGGLALVPGSAGGEAKERAGDKCGDRIILSEAWRARLLTLPVAGGPVAEVLGNLPGYPGAIQPAQDGQDSQGGYWLGLFAPRNQLLEFVLREEAYRRMMMAEVAPEHWIAPSLRSGRGFLEPLQAGSVKQLGVLKPWAPTLSFGLIVRLDAEFVPQFSFHSRADGHRHGITGLAATAQGLTFLAQGDGIIGTIVNEVTS